MPSVEIRPVRLSDAEGIAARIKTQNSAEEIREQIKMLESRAGWDHFVAVDETAVVGNILLLPTRYFPAPDPQRLEIADVVVAPTHQGQGLLRSLVDVASGRAKARGAIQLETSALASNSRAIAAYRSVGFEVWGTLPNAVLKRDGNRESLVLFAKSLG